MPCDMASPSKKLSMLSFESDLQEEREIPILIVSFSKRTLLRLVQFANVLETQFAAPKFNVASISISEIQP